MILFHLHVRYLVLSHVATNCSLQSFTVCDSSCSSCTVAQNPAYCLTCADGRRLNGNTPTTCLLNSNTCNGSTYLQSNGECAGMHGIIAS